MSEFNLLPPAPGKCRLCAIAHKEEAPHDATSFYYRFLFKNTYGRDPTWADAMNHCDEATKEAWCKYLAKLGIDVNSTNVFGNIKSQEDVDQALREDK